MTQEVKPIAKVPCPNPEVEAMQGDLKSATGKTTIREMEMGVTVRKGEAPTIFKYTREDR
jgi:hypothetical protein